MIYIYGLKDPITEEIRYIGKTNDIKRRLRRHCYDFSEDNYRTRWIAKLKRQELRPTIETLELCEDFDWVWYEKWWIAYGKLQGWHLTNTDGGGLGALGRKPTEESKAKASKAMKGRAFTEQHLTNLRKAVKERQSKSFLGKRHTEETKKKIGQYSRLRKASVETKAKMSVVHAGERNGRSKLTAEEIKDIRFLFQLGVSDLAVSRLYHVSKSSANNIRLHKTWKGIK